MHDMGMPVQPMLASNSAPRHLAEKVLEQDLKKVYAR
jgi:hypothetical protein